MIQRNSRRIFAACLIGSLLVAAAGCAKPAPVPEPKMDVPDSENVTFTQMEKVDTEAWANSTVTVPITCKDVEMRAGGTAALHIFENDSEPVTGQDEITTYTEELVLNSTGVQLGKGGTVLDLAENELHRWNEYGCYSSVRYTQPFEVGEGRYLVNLELSNEGFKLKQAIFFSDLGNGIARIDRLWRTVEDLENDEGSAAFDAAANYLISENAR